MNASVPLNWLILLLITARSHGTRTGPGPLETATRTHYRVARWQSLAHCAMRRTAALRRKRCEVVLVEPRPRPVVCVVL